MDTLIANPSVRLVFDHEGVRRITPINDLPFTIGRGADRHLILEDLQISREHACIERDDEGYLLLDTGSRHGTFVNGVRISATHLCSGDSIKFGAGRDVFMFEDEGSATRTLIAQWSRSGKRDTSQSDLEKLTLFLKAAQSLGSIGATNDILQTMLEYTIRLSGAERGFVFLGEDSDHLRLTLGQDQDGRVIVERPGISYSAVRQAADSQLDFVISDTSDEAAQGRDSLIVNAIRSLVAIPLRCEGSDRLLGVLYLDSHSGRHDFSRTGGDILHAIARQSATLLDNLRLLELERDSVLLRKELEIAASIQSEIIPRTLPEFPFVRLSARTIPCTGVGGDFYDVIRVRNGFVAILADVCGKGISAALLASTVQGMLHGLLQIQAENPVPLAEVAQALNAFVCSRAPRERYVTLAILRYVHGDSGPDQVELINAGHVAPVILRADGRYETVSDGDLPVGLLDLARFHSIHLSLDVKDRIVLLSDGITEAEDAQGTQIDATELQRRIAGPDPVKGLFEAIQQFCRGAHSQDDQTVLAIERLA